MAHPKKGVLAVDNIFSAVLDTKPWMARFSRGEYAAAAEAYRARYEGGIRAALAQYGPVSLAQQLLDAAADACQRAGLLSRRVRRMDIRTVIAVYLNPLLLAAEDEGCAQLAAELCRLWRQKWPGEGYEIADFETVCGGFRRKVLGFELNRPLGGGRGGGAHPRHPTEGSGGGGYIPSLLFSGSKRI